MKVLHICESLRGGAGKAVYRLHEALLNQGIESRILTRNPGEYVLEVYTYNLQEPLKKLIVKKIRSRIGNAIDPESIYIQKWQEARAGSRSETFTFPVSTNRVEDHALIGWADIIHLHWTSGFLNWPTFFSAINKPLAWTVHDTNTLNGGFHYLLEMKLEENRKLKELNEELLELKKQSFSRFKNKLMLIAPSTWMLDNIRHSFFKNNKSTQILYTIQPHIFRNRNRYKFREAFDIPENKKCILIMLEERIWKGLDILEKFFLRYKDPDVHLVVLRSHQSLKFNTNLPITYIERIHQELLLSLLYNSVDLFITASLEDNLPNTVIESICCGTPVVAFRIGGMTDLIEHGQNGFLADKVTAESIGSCIEKALAESWDHDVISIAAHTKFDSHKIAASHIEVYKELLS
jgi:glycosyltransferase involved in cell wall biosynthesis